MTRGIPHTVVRTIRRNLRRYRMRRKAGNRWLPDTVYPDDVFVVSYQKSGNTWVRFIIANLIKRDAEETIDFYTSNNYVPEVDRHSRIISSLPRPRMIKSHAPFQSPYPNVIYCVRDGRDVYVSYYFHRRDSLLPGMTFGEFLARPKHHPCLWSEHVDSWLRAERQPRMIVVRYEDLSQDAEREALRIASFLGLDPTADQLRQAVAQSSFENMRRLEMERGRPYKAEGPELFMRRGQPGNWKEYFGEKEKELFKQREGETLIRLGYESDEGW